MNRTLPVRSWQRFRCPVAIVAGEHDEIIRRDETERLARDIPGARLVIQPTVSHFAMLQNPGMFTGDLMEFLPILTK